MKLARVTLVLGGLGFLAFGAASLVAPARIAALVSIVLDNPVAATDFRALYGGLELGVGGFLLLTVTREAWFRLGLTATCLTYGGLAAGRTLGMIVDGSVGQAMIIALATEVGVLVLAAVALARLETSP